MESVLLEKEGPIGWLVLNRPEKRNALSLDVMNEVLERLDQAARDETIRVLVICGNGPMFSAGHDIKEMCGDHQDLHQLRAIFTTCNRMMQRLHQLPQPVIAQVHGIATAAGCQLVAACDLAIAEEGARFATPGVKIGLFCTTPMVPLVRLVGRRRAMEMLLTGRFISSQEALQFGLVNRVVSADQLTAATRQWALEIAEFSRFTLALGKQAFYEQIDLAEPEAYNFAKEVIAMNCLADDAQEGMKAFLEKRKPVFRGR
ncbi:MAG TPA: enoyl-CoA hydratase [Syntrophobacteraceae bacterium]|nr:enoyl-CoA hydratase [Syntrophobacteraceae bacterium]HBD08385.1 enoyl-CoA hydratase [Syntrophobacteraceae bacterium]HBZ57134.1 enoyl-CoA hydratase [Syntrophobacteraceae bacterium]